MPALKTATNLTGHDDIYEGLVRLHEGLSEEQSLRRWAKLVLILANHVGDRAVVEEAIEMARKEGADRRPEEKTS